MKYIIIRRLRRLIESNLIVRAAMIMAVFTLLGLIGVCLLSHKQRREEVFQSLQIPSVERAAAKPSHRPYDASQLPTILPQNVPLLMFYSQSQEVQLSQVLEELYRSDKWAVANDQERTEMAIAICQLFQADRLEGFFSSTTFKSLLYGSSIYFHHFVRWFFSIPGVIITEILLIIAATYLQHLEAQAAQGTKNTLQIFIGILVGTVAALPITLLNMRGEVLRNLAKIKPYLALKQKKATLNPTLTNLEISYATIHHKLPADSRLLIDAKFKELYGHYGNYYISELTECERELKTTLASILPGSANPSCVDIPSMYEKISKWASYYKDEQEISTALLLLASYIEECKEYVATGELSEENPCRSFVIVTGVSGTGKTFLLQQFLKEAEINYESIHLGLGGETIVSAIQKLNQKQKGGPTGLLLDDADRFFNNKHVSPVDLAFLDPTQRWIRDPISGVKYQAPNLVIIIANHPLKDDAMMDRATLVMNFNKGFKEAAKIDK